MTVLKYPKNGIYNLCKEELSSCSSLLTNAYNISGYKVPSNFSYRTYMNDLKTKLNSYKIEMNNIIGSIQKVSNTYEELEVDMTNDVKNIQSYKVEKRERLIRP